MSARATTTGAVAAAALVILGGAAQAAPRPAPIRPAPPAGSRYVAELPLMPGLWESGSGYLFPMGPGARLAETRLLGRADEGAVRGFYVAALQRAGWRPEGAAPGVYRRGRERLVLHLAPHRAGGGVLTEALFVVTPAPAPSGTAPRKTRRRT